MSPIKLPKYATKPMYNGVVLRHACDIIASNYRLGHWETPMEFSSYWKRLLAQGLLWGDPRIDQCLRELGQEAYEQAIAYQADFCDRLQLRALLIDMGTG